MPRRARIKATLAAVAAGGAVVAGATATAAPAAAAPSAHITSTYLWLSDPFPFGFQTAHFTVVKPGLIHVTLSKMCSSFEPTGCVDYSRPMNVAWINTATGRTGALTVPEGGAYISSGSGPIGLGAVFGVPATPGVATVNA